MLTQLALIPPILITLLLASPLAATQQERSVEAALADLQDGHPDNPLLFLFQGCPQEDAVGRAVFEAVRDVDLPAYGRVYLAGRFAANSYPTCNYQPLNRWVATVFSRLHSEGAAGPAQTFARGLGPLIDDELRDALLAAAEDEAFAPVGTRQIFAEAAIRHRPPEVQVEEAIAAFGRDIPRHVKTLWTYRLGRGRGAEFFPALAAAAPTLPDDALQTVADAINFDIDSRRVNPDAPGLAQFRNHLRGRAGVGARFQLRSAPREPR